MTRRGRAWLAAVFTSHLLVLVIACENPQAPLACGAIPEVTVNVTVTATDGGGLQGQNSFRVMVPNRAPLPEGTIPPISVFLGEREAVDASFYFREPDTC